MGDFELDLVLDLNGHLVWRVRLHEFHNSASFRLLSLSPMISQYFTRAADSASFALHTAMTKCYEREAMTRETFTIVATQS
jgi:hypothetical protein